MRFAGHNFEPLPSGALYWHSQQTLLVADLHFEKMASFARRGQMLPPYDTGMTLARLEADLRRTGAVRLIDCMPPADGRHDVVRVVEGLRGKVKMAMKLVVRFDYGKTVPWVSRGEGGLKAVAGPNALVLRSEIETRGEDLSTLAEFTVAAGERRTFVLTWYRSHEPAPERFDALEALVRQSGLSALIATHNLSLAARMDRKVTLSEGKVVPA